MCLFRAWAICPCRSSTGVEARISQETPASLIRDAAEHDSRPEVILFWNTCTTLHTSLRS